MSNPTTGCAVVEFGVGTIFCIEIVESSCSFQSYEPNILNRSPLPIKGGNSKRPNLIRLEMIFFFLYKKMPKYIKQIILLSKLKAIIW